MNITNDFPEEFSEKSFWNKLAENFKEIGLDLCYKSLTLFYCSQDDKTPAWARTTALGALGYLIWPFDAIPDMTPVVGYTDDLGAIALAIATIGLNITKEHKIMAKKKLEDWFGEISDEDLDS